MSKMNINFGSIIITRLQSRYIDGNLEIVPEKERKVVRYKFDP